MGTPRGPDPSGFATLVAMTRAGIRSFWASPDRAVPRVRVIEMAPVMFLLILCAAQTVQAGPVMRFMQATAQSLHTPGGLHPRRPGSQRAKHPKGRRHMTRLLPFPFVSFGLLLLVAAAQSNSLIGTVRHRLRDRACRRVDPDHPAVAKSARSPAECPPPIVGSGVGGHHPLKRRRWPDHSRPRKATANIRVREHPP